jgi:hypothetical protein
MPEEERRRRCGCRASQTPSTVQDADLTVGPALDIPDGLLQSAKWTFTLRSAGHLVTIGGCSVRWNPRTDAQRHEQVFGDLIPTRTIGKGFAVIVSKVESESEYSVRA